MFYQVKDLQLACNVTLILSTFKYDYVKITISPQKASVYLLREERLMLVTAQDVNSNGALFSLMVLGELVSFLLHSGTVGKCSLVERKQSLHETAQNMVYGLS